MGYILGRLMCSFFAVVCDKGCFSFHPNPRERTSWAGKEKKEKKSRIWESGGSVQAAILLPQKQGGGLVVRVGVGEEGRQLYVRRLWKEEGEGEPSRWQFMMPHTWRAHENFGKNIKLYFFQTKSLKLIQKSFCFNTGQHFCRKTVLNFLCTN